MRDAAAPAVLAREPQAAETPAAPAAATLPDAVAPIAARRAPPAAPASPGSGTHGGGASAHPRGEMTTIGI
jgi:hypothetical protein